MQAHSKIIALPKRSSANLQSRPDARKKRARADRLVMVLFVIFLGWVAITMGQQEIRLRHLRQQLQAVTLEQEQQSLEKQSLEEELAEAKSERYIERVARDKLGFLRPGDYFYLVGKSGAPR
ncbi:MAG: FtsB family cell division protein [Bacillota bacterium]